ncbi:uncharacterized protein J8A68_002161 [[Candida] subhashii]|uniref:Protein FMP42 n=1 Tax=[Candida] subhashii TaxID=561895 RepID=A0A8J5QLE9_9ASCO|nr:uncharacterized protein J8A68_002161 [[Candida] subhashii]KAG7664303.1 hypothetical protein J8A68_002161 [[Candida] subhashii]
MPYRHHLPPLSTRLIQIGCAITWCLVAAGIVFGFAAIKPILISEHVYEEKCQISAFEEVKCSAQELALDLLFTLACMTTNISALPVGWILDSYGPQVTGIIGAGVLVFASISLSFANKLAKIDGYLIGYSLLALAGPFVFISCFQLANSFPKHSGLILALITGSFDSSSALFLFYRLFYTNVYQLSLSGFFGFYLIVPVFICLCQVFIMPKESYKTVATLAKIAETGIDETGKPLDVDLLLPQDQPILQSDQDEEEDDEVVEQDEGVQFYQPTISETAHLLIRRDPIPDENPHVRRASFTSVHSNKSAYEQEADIKLINSTGGVFGIMHGYSIRAQMSSHWFLLMTFFTTSQMLRINYFVATIKSQELYLYDNNEELATSINQFFDLALPLGGVVAIPFIGLILDNCTTLAVLTSLTCLSLFAHIMGLLAWIPGTYMGILVLVVYRPFFYTAVSDFCAKVFGFDTFGTVYGTIIAFSGLCNVFQQVLDKATHEMFNKNPGPVNILLTGLTAITGLAIIGFVRSQELEIKRRQLEVEAQEAINRPIPT